MRSAPACAAAMLVLSGVCNAHQTPARASSLEGSTTQSADKPATIIAAHAADPEIAKLIGLLTPSVAGFEAPAQGDRPALRIHTVPATVSGLDNAVLFELSRADSPAEPFRTVILHPYRRQGQLRMRIFDLTGTPGLADVFTGAWAAPEAMPKLVLANLDPNLDMPLTADGSGFKGATTQPFPTTRDGAIEMTSALRIDASGISIADAGFDAEGKKVWGYNPEQAVEFKKAGAESAPAVIKRDDGLVIITFVQPAPDAPKLTPGGELTAHYSGWLTDGTRFDSSRQPGRQPLTIRLPGGVIAGWNEGLMGIAKGERRRLIIPAALAWGDRGRAPLIPPNSAVIFDVEAMHVDNSAPQPPAPPPAPTPPTTPHTPGATPPAQASPSGQPVGKPPTNSSPEKPR